MDNRILKCLMLLQVSCVMQSSGTISYLFYLKGKKINYINIAKICYLLTFLNKVLFWCLHLFISSDFLFNKSGSSKYFVIQYFSIKQSLHDNGLAWPYTIKAIDHLIL